MADQFRCRFRRAFPGAFSLTTFLDFAIFIFLAAAPCETTPTADQPNITNRKSEQSSVYSVTQKECPERGWQHEELPAEGRDRHSVRSEMGFVSVALSGRFLEIVVPAGSLGARGATRPTTTAPPTRFRHSFCSLVIGATDPPHNGRNTISA